MARANAERFIEAAATATSVSSGPDQSLCPRCQRPLMDPFGLGLCSACGYCHSLQNARTQIIPVPGKPEVEVPTKNVVLGEWAGFLNRLPDGCMLPFGGAAAVLSVSLYASAIFGAGAPLRGPGGLCEIVVGFLALLGAHYMAHKRLAEPVTTAKPAEKSGDKPAPKPTAPQTISLFAVGPIWRTAWAEMPETKAHLAGVTWGSALILGGLLFLLPYMTEAREHQTIANKLESETKAKTTREEEKKKERQTTGERLNNLNGQPGKPGYTPRPGTTNLTPVRPGDPEIKKPKLPEDPRPTVPCVILGYTTNSSKQLTGLVLGTVKEGQVVFAGLAEELDADQRAALEVKLSGLRRSDPLVEIPGLEAVWVNPKVYCEVHQSGTSESGRLERPRFRALIDE